MLTITKLSAKCDVEGCDKQAEAPLHQLSTAGWCQIFQYGGENKAVTLHHKFLNPIGGAKITCPSCSVQGHYKKMVKPGAVV